MHYRAFSLVQGDRLPEIVATATDGNGNPIDLSGVGITVFFSMSDKRTGEVKVENAAAVIVDGPAGRVKYVWAAVDVDNEGDDGQLDGEYRAHFRVKYPAPDGRILTVPNSGYIFITIRARQTAANP